jgi:hypothetical protein
MRPTTALPLTATLPHGLSLLRGDVRLASIDHAMWFHRDFRIDDWLLYQADSPCVAVACRIDAVLVAPNLRSPFAAEKCGVRKWGYGAKGMGKQVHQFNHLGQP